MERAQAGRRREIFLLRVGKGLSPQEPKNRVTFQSFGTPRTPTLQGNHQEVTSFIPSWHLQLETLSCMVKGSLLNKITRNTLASSYFLSLAGFWVPLPGPPPTAMGEGIDNS